MKLPIKKPKFFVGDTVWANLWQKGKQVCAKCTVIKLEQDPEMILYCLIPEKKLQSFESIVEFLESDAWVDETSNFFEEPMLYNSEAEARKHLK